jgi:serine/threonine protein kinase
MQLNGYSNLIKIGEGGMAHVFRGIQDSLRRPVAIKLLINDLISDDEARRRFELESYIIARLNHANIIHVIDRGFSTDNMPHFVMEFVEGIDLNTAAKIKQLDHAAKIDIIIQVLKALSYAHQNNVIHRDIKPDNILIDNNGNVKILDFGIAQFYDDQHNAAEKTVSGTVMGTYNYMSPEQRESADNVTEQSDLYSAGVLMYELFTGKLPAGRFPDPAELNPEVNPGLNALILKCLNQSPSARPRSAEELKNGLLAISQGAHLNTEKRLRAEQGITKIRSNFMLLDILREDKYGSVYLYQQKARGNLLIIKKKFNTSSGYEASNLLASLEHPHIVNTLGTSRNDRYFYLVQEYLSGGSLLDKLAFQLNWKDTLRIGSQICQALIFAHNNHIVHGHPRPTNILFTPEGDVKVTDFGLQDDLSDIENAHYYRLAGEERSQASDLYAVGIVLYQLFTGSLPKRDHDSVFVIRKQFSKLPEDIQQVISNMISTIPENRHRDSLLRAVSIFEHHLAGNHIKTFTDTPVNDKKRGRSQGVSPGASKSQATSPRRGMNLRKRTGILLSVLVVVFTQYLFFFDGQEQLSQSVPPAYEKLVDRLAEIAGIFNVRGSRTSEDSRVY